MCIKQRKPSTTDFKTIKQRRGFLTNRTFCGFLTFSSILIYYVKLKAHSNVINNKKKLYLFMNLY